MLELSLKAVQSRVEELETQNEQIVDLCARTFSAPDSRIYARRRGQCGLTSSFSKVLERKLISRRPPTERPRVHQSVEPPFHGQQNHADGVPQTQSATSHRGTIAPAAGDFKAFEEARQLGAQRKLYYVTGGHADYHGLVAINQNLRRVRNQIREEISKNNARTQELFEHTGKTQPGVSDPNGGALEDSTVIQNLKSLSEASILNHLVRQQAFVKKMSSAGWIVACRPRCFSEKV